MFGFKNYFDEKRNEKRKQRFIKMARQLKKLSDAELKNWYMHADTERILGKMCADEKKLFRKIEEELNRRGFEYMRDY